MNNTYECMVLLDNREVRQGWDTVKQTVTGMMTKHGAQVLSARFWAERPLAFPINHQQRGTYLLVYFESETDAVAPLNRELNMAEPVMRHVVTACDEIPESAHQPEAEFDVSAIGREPEEKKTPPAETGAVAKTGAAEDKPADKSTADKSTADKSTADKPTTDKPTADKTTAEKPTAEKPTADKPVEPTGEAE